MFHPLGSGYVKINAKPDRIAFTIQHFDPVA